MTVQLTISGLALTRGITNTSNYNPKSRKHQKFIDQQKQFITAANYQEKLSITVLIVDARIKKVLIAINTPIMTVGFTSLTSSFSNS